MRYLILTFVIFSNASFLLSQKEGNNWLMGLGYFGSSDSSVKVNHIRFDNGVFSVSNLYVDIPFFGSSSAVSDTSGQLVCYSNGLAIYNAAHVAIPNGSGLQAGNPNSFPFGYPADQGVLVMPVPDTTNLYYIIYENSKDITIDIVRTALKYAIVNGTQNAGTAGISAVGKLIVPTEDTLNIGYLNVVRHANGKDWWLMTTKFKTNLHRKFLVTKSGIHFQDNQNIGSKVENGVGFGCYSPDGNWYARYMTYGQTSAPKGGMYLYRFDRCTGQLSEPKYKDFSMDNFVYGSVAFSPNSRYMYLARMRKLYQYDMEATDVVASEQVVAEYDGFLTMTGNPTHFFGLALAPDGKIYCSVPNSNTNYIHVIDQPNLAGGACNFLQHAIFLPSQNFGTIPNIPDYTLGAIDTPCDTFVTTTIPVKTRTNIRVWPVPAADYLCFSVEQSLGIPLELQIYNSSGTSVIKQQDVLLNPVYTFYINELPPGLYFYTLRDMNGNMIGKGKVVRTITK
jgi:hypothetical protein